MASPEAAPEIVGFYTHRFVLYRNDVQGAILFHPRRKGWRVASRQNPAAGKFARYVREEANKANYAVGSSMGDGKARLAKESGMSEADISKILKGEYEAPAGPLKPLAAALDVDFKELLRAAGVLEDKPARASNRPLTVSLAAQRLGIKSAKNIEAFETIVAALLLSERRR